MSNQNLKIDNSKLGSQSQFEIFPSIFFFFLENGRGDISMGNELEKNTVVRNFSLVPKDIRSMKTRVRTFSRKQTNARSLIVGQ